MGSWCKQHLFLRVLEAGSQGSLCQRDGCSVRSLFLVDTQACAYCALSRWRVEKGRRDREGAGASEGTVPFSSQKDVDLLPSPFCQPKYLSKTPLRYLRPLPRTSASPSPLGCQHMGFGGMKAFRVVFFPWPRYLSDMPNEFIPS